MTATPFASRLSMVTPISAGDMHGIAWTDLRSSQICALAYDVSRPGGPAVRVVIDRREWDAYVAARGNGVADFRTYHIEDWT